MSQHCNHKTPNNGRQNGFISRMLFSELYKIMVNEVTSVGFKGGNRPPRIPPWSWPLLYWRKFLSLLRNWTTSILHKKLNT